MFGHKFIFDKAVVCSQKYLQCLRPQHEFRVKKTTRPTSGYCKKIALSTMTYSRGLRFPVSLETLQHLLLLVIRFLHLFELLTVHFFERIYITIHC